MVTLKHPSASVKPDNQASCNVTETAVLINRIVLAGYFANPLNFCLSKSRGKTQSWTPDAQNDCLKLGLTKIIVVFYE